MRRPFCLIGSFLEEAFSACERAEEVSDGVAGVVFGRCQGWWEQPPEESTMISAAQLLDELMGRDRNLAPDEKRSNVRWDHESVSPAGFGPVPGAVGEGSGADLDLGPPGPRRDLGPGARRGRVCLTPWREGAESVAREGGDRADPGIRGDLFLLLF